MRWWMALIWPIAAIIFTEMIVAGLLAYELLSVGFRRKLPILRYFGFAFLALALQAVALLVAQGLDTPRLNHTPAWRWISIVSRGVFVLNLWALFFFLHHRLNGSPPTEGGA